MVRLKAPELDIVDTLITAGIANSRAEAIRWALARISERPAYAQLRQTPPAISKGSDRTLDRAVARHSFLPRASAWLEVRPGLPAATHRRRSRPETHVLTALTRDPRPDLHEALGRIYRDPGARYRD